MDKGPRYPGDSNIGSDLHRGETTRLSNACYGALKQVASSTYLGSCNAEVSNGGGGYLRVSTVVYHLSKEISVFKTWLSFHISKQRAKDRSAAMDQNVAPVELCLQSTFSNSPGSPSTPPAMLFLCYFYDQDSRLVSKSEQSASRKQKMNPISN